MCVGMCTRSDQNVTTATTATGTAQRQLTPEHALWNMSTSLCPDAELASSTSEPGDDDRSSQSAPASGLRVGVNGNGELARQRRGRVGVTGGVGVCVGGAGNASSRELLLSLREHERETETDRDREGGVGDSGNVSGVARR